MPGADYYSSLGSSDDDGVSKKEYYATGMYEYEDATNYEELGLDPAEFEDDPIDAGEAADSSPGRLNSSAVWESVTSAKDAATSTTSTAVDRATDKATQTVDTARDAAVDSATAAATDSGKAVLGASPGAAPAVAGTTIADKLGIGISDDWSSTDDALGGSITERVIGTDVDISDDWTTTDDALDGQTITEAVTGRDIGISDDWSTTDDALGEETTLAETVGETAGNAGKNLSEGLNKGAGAAGISEFTTKATYGIYAVVALAVIFVVGQLFDIGVNQG